MALLVKVLEMLLGAAMSPSVLPWNKRKDDTKEVIR